MGSLAQQAQEQAVTDEVFETAKNRANVVHSSASDRDFIGPVWVRVHPTDGQPRFDQAGKSCHPRAIESYQ